jgi:WhiB family redox-sensing transcriptional regulator
MLLARPEWNHLAACKGRDKEFCLFLPSKPKAEDRARMAAAVAICQTCPVMEPCRERAITMPENARIFGSVVGGLTPTQLNVARRQRRDDRQRPRCETEAAYKWHREHGERCLDCLKAHSVRVNLYKRRKRRERAHAA